MSNVLEAVLYRGELPRGDVGALLGTSYRHARRVIAALVGRNVLVSGGPRVPIPLAFPAAFGTPAGRRAISSEKADESTRACRAALF